MNKTKKTSYYGICNKCGEHCFHSIVSTFDGKIWNRPKEKFLVLRCWRGHAGTKWVDADEN